MALSSIAAFTIGWKQLPLAWLLLGVVGYFVALCMRPVNVSGLWLDYKMGRRGGVAFRLFGYYVAAFVQGLFIYAIGYIAHKPFQ